MKNIGKIVLLGAVIAASVSIASATSITYTLGSFATGSSIGADSNSAMSWIGVDYTVRGGVLGSFSAPPQSTTYTLNPYSTWLSPVANSTWIGMDPQAGPDGSFNPPYGYYEFQTTFSAVAGLYSGVLDVLADDTTEVLLNGTQIVTFGSLGGDGQCADNVPNCTSQDIISLNNVALLANNTLTFIVEQVGENYANNDDPSGVDFDASLTSTPEPSSLLLLGTGLVGAAGLLLRRRQRSHNV